MSEAVRDNGCCLEARGLVKTFDNGGRVEVLTGADLTLAPGETVAVVGTSGTGKTTLLHLLGGLDRPTSGTVRYFGRDIHRHGDLDRLRNRTIGFVFQFHCLLREFTALENVIMPGLIGGLPARSLVQRGRRLLAEVGLADRCHHRPGELSGGEQQRVALARALVMEPAVLLADEPTGNLDPRTGKRVFELLLETNRRHGLAMVMVTHNLALAARLDRCLRLRDGRLVPETPSESCSP